MPAASVARAALVHPGIRCRDAGRYLGTGAIVMTTETRLHYGRSVDLEDGLVVLPAGKNKRVFWVQCPACGPQPPLTAAHEPWADCVLVSHINVSGVASCSVCFEDAPYKEILIPKLAVDLRGGSHEKCTGRCLDGKAFCACHCRGRCHGEGHCFCKEDTVA